MKFRSTGAIETRQWTVSVVLNRSASLAEVTVM